MSHERLAELIQACQVAMEADETQRVTHVAIWSLLTTLNQHEITEGQALRILGWQAIRLPHAPTHAALYRQAAADLRQMLLVEH